MGLRLIHLFEELNRLGTSVIIATHSKQLVERLGYSQLQPTDGRLAIIPGRAEAEAAVAASTGTTADAEDIQNRHPDSRPAATGEEDLYDNKSGVESYL